MAESLGDVLIDVHANTSKVPGEMDRGLKRAARDAEKGLGEAGEDMGDTLAAGISDEVGRHGKDFAKAVETSVAKETIRVRSRISYHNVRDSRGRFTRGLGESIADEIGDALERASGRGGIFSNIGTGIADAVGAGFNVSGRSPLIAVLVPALLALGGLILAAIQAVGALVALLATIPALVAAIGLQVGAVAFAFNGVGEAAKNAFAAKNAQELQKAVEGLTPAAQSFVKSLIPIRDFFKEVRNLAQESFFRAFGDSLTQLLGRLGPTLKSGIGNMAAGMGVLFAQLADFFGSPSFVTFIDKLIPSTLRWLSLFGPGFVTLLTGLVDVATAALPFLEAIGKQLSGDFKDFGRFLSDLANDPGFLRWLVDMSDTFFLFMRFLEDATKFLASFMDTLNESGGPELILELSAALQMLAFFLQTPVGQEGMKALVALAIFGIQSFTGLVIAVFAVLAAFRAMGVFIEWLVGFIVTTFVDGFNSALSTIQRVAEWIGRFFSGLAGAAVEFVRRASGTIASLPNRAIAAIGNLGARLFNAGRALIQGFIDGIRSKFAPLENIARSAMNIIGRFLPGSPAEEGPLSGAGYTRYRGQRMMRDLALGMKDEARMLRQTSLSTATNITFGPNSIQMQFAGGLPDQSQARTTGRAMGMSAAGIIAERNTRLAVRTL